MRSEFQRGNEEEESEREEERGGGSSVDGPRSRIGSSVSVPARPPSSSAVKLMMLGSGGSRLVIVECSALLCPGAGDRLMCFDAFRHASGLPCLGVRRLRKLTSSRPRPGRFQTGGAMSRSEYIAWPFGCFAGPVVKEHPLL